MREERRGPQGGSVGTSASGSDQICLSVAVCGDGMHQTNGALLYCLDADGGLPVWRHSVPGDLGMTSASIVRRGLSSISSAATCCRRFWHSTKREKGTTTLGRESVIDHLRSTIHPKPLGRARLT